MNWESLRQYYKRNEKDIRVLFDSSYVNFRRDQRAQKVKLKTDWETSSDESTEDETITVEELIKNKIMKYINPKLEKMLGICIKINYKGNTKYKLSKGFDF
jgi:hypothetical protein